MAKRKIHACDARRLLTKKGISFAKDYHVLSTDEKYEIADMADAAGYRKSKTAPGSTSRMYYAYLSRLNCVGKGTLAGSRRRTTKRRRK